METINSTEIVAKKVKKNFSPLKFLLILLSILALVCLGYLGYEYYQKDMASRSEITKLNESLKTSQEELKSTQELLNTAKSDLENKSKIVDVRTVLPSGARSFTYLSSCGVGISIPDSTQGFDPTGQSLMEYIGFRTWRLGYQKLLDDGSEFKGSPFIGGTEYYVQLMNDEDASGYNPGFVGIKCTKNTNNWDTTVLTTNYLKQIKAWSLSTAKELGETFSTSKIKEIGNETKWGVDTKKVSIRAFSAAESQLETGNLFAVGNKIYYVYYSSSSSNAKAIASMKGIFDSLVIFNK